MNMNNIITELVNTIKDLPPLYRIIGVIAIVFLIIFFLLSNKKKKNSDNFKGAIFNKDTDINIGDKKNDTHTYSKSNSDNFKKSTFHGKSKINIGDSNGKKK